MGRPGSLTFSFFRDVSREKKYQKLARSGKEVRAAIRPMSSQLALSSQESKQGTLINRAIRARLEKPSPPGPSAGRTPSFIEGDCTMGLKSFL
jgi:hypothetical protein